MWQPWWYNAYIFVCGPWLDPCACPPLSLMWKYCSHSLSVWYTRDLTSRNLTSTSCNIYITWILPYSHTFYSLSLSLALVSFLPSLHLPLFLPTLSPSLSQHGPSSLLSPFSPSPSPLSILYPTLAFITPIPLLTLVSLLYPRIIPSLLLPSHHLSPYTLHC